jgi:UDP-N-acetylglucosamine:LPS N-acetylglucosamine transferase
MLDDVGPARQASPPELRHQPGKRRRIVVVSATIGAGHDAATLELSRRLRQRGYDVTHHDFMDLLPLRMGRRARGGHHAVLRRAPWFYGLLFAVGDRSPITPPLTRLLLAPSRRRVLELVDDDVIAVVSTYPLASQVIGPLRRGGRLRAPAVTYVTDFAVHRYWVAPGVDAHLAAHPLGAAAASDHGGRRPRSAGALVRERFRPATPAGKQAARAELGLPAGRLALVVAGSWGVGEVEATAAEVAATGVATPVVVCGHNELLRARLVRLGVPHALGWVEDMATLMNAADVLIENAGGIMALEGMACGLPVVTYRPIPGHGTRSAAALEQAGLSTWVRAREQLGPALVAATDGAAGAAQRRAADVLFAADAAECIDALLAEPALPALTAARPAVAPRPRRILAAAVTFGLSVYSGLSSRVRRGAARSRSPRRPRAHRPPLDRPQ